MGSSVYWYYVPYETDFNQALQKLRQKEFAAGRYYPVMEVLEFPPKQKTSPGKKHATIFDVIDEVSGDGTRSILDLDKVSHVDDYGIARLLNEQDLVYYFNTTTPTRKDIEENCENLYDSIDRGKGYCVVVYKNKQPNELYFVGYSFD